MTPYQAYQLHEIERPKSRAEIHQANEQLGRMAKTVSALWKRTAQAITAPIPPRDSRRSAPAQRHAARARRAADHTRSLTTR